MGKKSKRKTRWRSLPIGDVSSQNEEDGDEGGEKAENGPVSGLHYRKYRTNNAAATGYRYYQHAAHRNTAAHTVQQNGDKKLFNEDEYTKITTPRQDVLFKKGYLGRRRPLPSPVNGDTPQGLNGERGTENGESADNASEASSETVTSQEQPLMYSGGYVDPHGGPIFYLNGAYDIYEPYSGVYSSFMLPAGPGYGGGPAGSVLTAVPCQSLPLQPLEWFNPRGHPELGGGGWCLVAPCPPMQQPHLPQSHRKKRYSTDSQNCSPHSSESTGPPGSPQHDEDEPELTPELYSQPPPYVYPGYMFGPAVYNVNGVAVPGPTPVQSNGSLPEHANGNGVVVNGVNGSTENGSVDLASASAAAQAKRRKKKRRRKRRRGCRGDGAGTDEGSEESSSEEAVEDKDVGEDLAACAASAATAAMSSGSGSAPASLPPATSSSCSELSSPHNSHDEMEATGVPLRPSRKQNSRSDPKLNPQTAPLSSPTPNAQKICDLLQENVAELPVVVETIQDNQQHIVSEVAPEEISVKQELQQVVQEDVVAEVSAEILSEPVIEAAASIIESASESIECFECNVFEPEALKVVNNEERVVQKNGKLSRKGSRKLKHQQQQQQQQLSCVLLEENKTEIETASLSIPQERAGSSLSWRESEEAAASPAVSPAVSPTISPANSPVPPPRRRGKAKHRPPTPCNLASEHEILAQHLSEQIINEAIVAAITQCSTTETVTAETTDSPLTQRPITDAVTNWLHTNPDPLINLDDLSEEEDDDEKITGSKNGIINPLPAPSNSFVNVSTDGPEKRVGNNASLIEHCNKHSTHHHHHHHHHRRNSWSSMLSSEGCSGEWDSWDDSPEGSKPAEDSQIHKAATTAIQDDDTTTSLPASKYDPAVSVAKYYQLTHDPVIKLKPQEAWLPANEVISDSGIESGDEPQSPKINFNERSIKFVGHLQGGFPDAEVFPCGACCNIQ